MGNSITEWLAAFPAEEAQERIAELDRRIAAMETERRELAQFLAMAGNAAPIPGQMAIAGSNGNGHEPRGMRAVEVVMRERPGVWTRRDIARVMAERGWIAQGDAGRHTLGSIMNRMVARGRVVRVGHARYRLPREDEGVLAA